MAIDPSEIRSAAPSGNFTSLRRAIAASATQAGQANDQ